jgi:hypothetical protein
MSVLQDLIYEIQQLKTSDPVFNIRKETGGWSGNRIVLKPVSVVGYPKNIPDCTDPIGGLARMFHKEHFDSSRRKFVINVDGILENIRSEIKNWVNNFIRHNCSDNQELVRWYDYHALSSTNLEKTYFEPLLGIYKYMLLHEGAQDNQKHETNVIALLDLIFQRDYKEQHLPQRKRRRRRMKR